MPAATLQGLSLLVLILAVPARAQDADFAQRVKQEVKRLRDATSSWDIEYEESVPDDASAPVHSGRYLRAEGGRMLRFMRAKLVDGRWLSQKTYQDGKQRIIVSTEDDSKPNVLIQPAEGDFDATTDFIPSAAAMLMPDGKSIARLIADGARIEPGPDPNIAILTAPFKNREGFSIRCELDGQHDWLARKYDIVTPKLTNSFRVESFARGGDGRFFPATIRYDTIGPDGSQGQMVARTTRFAYNGDYPASTFKPALNVPGMMIQNDIKGTKVLVPEPNASRGGYKAPPIPPPDNPSRPPIRIAPRDNRAWVLLGVVSAGLIALGLTFKHRMRRA